MENQNQLIEIMAEMLQEQRLMRQEMVAAQQQTNAHLLSVDQRLDTLNTRISNVEKEIIQIKENGFKVNLAIGELYRSVQQLNDQMSHFAEHENRIRKLEQILKVA